MANYVGNKGGQGIREFLINYFPKSERYFSLFYGAGGFENCSLTNGSEWVCSEINPANKIYETETAVIVYSNYKNLLTDNEFTQNDFVFSDPPYLLRLRLSQKKYYKFEFDIPDHIEFLDYASGIKAKHLITHPKCDLYDSMLPDYECIEFSYQTRGGEFNDAIYINYSPEAIELFNYNGLGKNFTHRQQIKRKRKNLIKKVKAWPVHDREAFFRELNK